MERDDEIKKGDGVIYYGSSTYIPCGAIGIMDRYLTNNTVFVRFPDNPDRRYRSGIGVSIKSLERL